MMILRVAREIIKTPWRRAGLAFGISILMHTAIVWLPQIHLPLSKVQLPPLSVRLEMVPEQQNTPDKVTQEESRHEQASSTNSPGIKSSGKVQSVTPSTMKKMEKSEISRQFPKHLQLFFTVYKGAGRSLAGEEVHNLDLQSERYILKGTKRISKLSGLHAREQYIQTSHGVIGEQGLHPEVYKEEITASGRKQDVKVNFDWPSQMLQFSHLDNERLPSGAQDALSFLYQLSQISLQKEIVIMPVVEATGLKDYQFEISRPEEIDTPGGKLRAVRLRSIHRKGDPYLEIWLGLEYRLLPVKFTRVNGEEEVIEESVISDIRASDE